LPAPVANEEVAAIATGQAVLVIANALSPWLAGLAAHQGQGAERRGQELVRISVMAAGDVMRESAGPALAGVTGAHGEDIAAGTQGDRTRVPLARRDHLEPGAVGPDPDNASARKLDAPPVFADSPGNPLVAHGQVEIAVNARSNASGDVVVDSLGGECRRAQAGDQLDPFVGPAVAVRVAERSEFGWMDDIERAVDPFQA